jgi:hypothetical protein
MNIDEIVALLHREAQAPLPANELPHEQHWAAVESGTQFGVCFPTDYKQLLSQVGTVLLGGKFCLFNPAAKEMRHALSYQNIANLYRQHRLKLFAFDVPVFPEPRGMIPIATEHRGIRLAFMPDVRGELETVLIDLKNGDVERHGRDFLRFMAELLEGPRRGALAARLAHVCKFGKTGGVGE